VSVTPFRRLEFFLVHTKLERFPRYLLAFGGHLQVHELEGAARCRFRGAQTHQQLDQGRKASAHGTELFEEAGQTLAAHGRLFGLHLPQNLFARNAAIHHSSTMTVKTVGLGRN
jgi:hypothetical protein